MQTSKFLLPNINIMPLSRADNIQHFRIYRVLGNNLLVLKNQRHWLCLQGKHVRAFRSLKDFFSSGWDVTGWLFSDRLAADRSDTMTKSGARCSSSVCMQYPSTSRLYNQSHPPSQRTPNPLWSRNLDYFIGGEGEWVIGAQAVPNGSQLKTLLM